MLLLVCEIWMSWQLHCYLQNFEYDIDRKYSIVTYYAHSQWHSHKPSRELNLSNNLSADSARLDFSSLSSFKHPTLALGAVQNRPDPFHGWMID